MSCRLIRALCTAAVLAFSTLAVANQKESTGPTLAEIHAQQTELHADVVAGKAAFKDMSNQDRADLAKRQQEVLGLIEGKQSLDELNDIDKVRAFNLLESIKATIAKNDGDRVICERRKPAGSNRVERFCATVAERRRMQESSSDAMSKRPLCNGVELCKAN